MNALELVTLPALMERTSGSPDIMIGLIDGPVATQRPDLSGGRIRELHSNRATTCSQVKSAACVHGTFVAGILSARRESDAPAICPNCTLIVRPIFAETQTGSRQMPSALPEELARAI